MNVYCIEQYAYNEDTNTYNICKGVVEVLSERVEALRFIDTLDEEICQPKQKDENRRQ